MNNFNAEDKPKKEIGEGFSCELFHCSGSNACGCSEAKDAKASGANGSRAKGSRTDGKSENRRLDFETFENWIDAELEMLESRFAHNVTLGSQRNDLKSSR